MKDIWYSCEGSDQRFAISVTDRFCEGRPIEQKWAAQQCAEDWFHEHDGWEASWPRDFSLYAEESGGEPIATLCVEMEAVPDFMATHKSPNSLLVSMRISLDTARLV